MARVEWWSRPGWLQEVIVSDINTVEIDYEVMKEIMITLGYSLDEVEML